MPQPVLVLEAQDHCQRSCGRHAHICVRHDVAKAHCRQSCENHPANMLSDCAKLCACIEQGMLGFQHVGARHTQRGSCFGQMAGSCPGMCEGPLDSETVNGFVASTHWQHVDRTTSPQECYSNLIAPIVADMHHSAPNPDLMVYVRNEDISVTAITAAKEQYTSDNAVLQPESYTVQLKASPSSEPW